MTADTPTPYVPPDGVILTTMAEARRIRHGEVSFISDEDLTRNLLAREDLWGPPDNGWDRRSAEDSALVWWRPTPEPTVTIELPESVARELASYGGIGYLSHRTTPAVVQATRDAITRLDGDD